MKIFCVKIVILVLPLMAVAYGIFRSEGGYSDPFYLRFTSTDQGAMVLGNSRAAQGINPSVLNTILDTFYQQKLYNYSFTLANSPYGRAYFNSIEKKLAKDVRDGFFILTVDPWSLSVNTADSAEVFSENENFIALMNEVSSNPNFEYLLRWYPTHYFDIISSRFFPGKLRLHEDGWLEVTVKMDTFSVRKRSNEKFQQYRKKIHHVKRSEDRILYLVNTINLLKGYGDVFLVRLPVAPEMFEIEYKVSPNFNDEMMRLAKEMNIPYLDLTGPKSEYQFTDGNHLFKKSAEEVSKNVANWISVLKRAGRENASNASEQHQ